MDLTLRQVKLYSEALARKARMERVAFIHDVANAISFSLSKDGGTKLAEHCAKLANEE